MAPSLRFMSFEILATGVLLLECILRSRMFSLVQATRLPRPLVALRFIAMNCFLLCQHDSVTISWLSYWTAKSRSIAYIQLFVMLQSKLPLPNTIFDRARHRACGRISLIPQ